MSDAVGRRREPPTVRALLSNLIDYAGLFPPASLPLVDAVPTYDLYLASDESWALGRFVIPATRLRELGTLLRARAPADRPRPAWHVSALLGSPADLEAVRLHNEQSGELALVDCVEMKVTDTASIEALAGEAQASYEWYAEIAPTADLGSLLAAARNAGVAAKIRTGGVSADAIPGAEEVAGFLVACRDAKVKVKATAGLHHAVRGEHPLTYAVGAPCGTMFGFMNVVLAAAALHAGAEPGVAHTLLEERRRGLLRLDEHEVRWGDFALSLEALTAARSNFIRAVGSCSFREPLDEMAALMIPGQC